MNNLQKFDNVLAEFDKEVSKLKSIGEVHQEIYKLAKDYKTAVSAIKESSDNLHSVLKEYQEFQNEVAKNISEIEKQYSKNKSDIQVFLKTKLDEFEKHYIKIQSESQRLITLKLEDIKKQNKDFEKSLSEIVDSLRKENKQFYRDFEETVRIKLAENKSEIKQLMEQETVKLRDIFASELDKRITEIVSRQKSLFTVILVSSGAVLFALTFIIYLLLKR